MELDRALPYDLRMQWQVSAARQLGCATVGWAAAALAPPAMKSQCQSRQQAQWLWPTLGSAVLHMPQPATLPTRQGGRQQAHTAMKSPLFPLRLQPEVHAFAPSVWLSGFEGFTVEFPWGELQQHSGVCCICGPTDRGCMTSLRHLCGVPLG